MTNIVLSKKMIAVRPKFTDTVRSLGYALDFSAEARFAMAAIEKNDELQACTPKSIAESLLTVASLGLSLNPSLAHVYLIPWKKQCSAMVGYRGLIHMAIEDGSVTSLDSDVVYENDTFVWQKGSTFHCEHSRVLDGKKRGAPVGAYCTWRTPDGLMHGEFMDESEIEKVRASSKMRSGAVWTKWTDEMRRKAVIKRASKSWKKTPRFAHRMQIINDQEGLDLERARREKIVHETVNASQVTRLEKMINGSAALKKKLLTAYAVSKLDDIPAASFDTVIRRIKEFKSRAASRRPASR